MSSLYLLLLSLNQFIRCEKSEKNGKTGIYFPKKYKVSNLKDLLPLSYNDCLLLIHYIHLQQSFLERKGCGFYKLALEDISVIESYGLDSNENILMFAYLNASHIKKINESGNIIFMTPFSNNTGFCSPEILAIKNIPCCVSHKCFYYSLGLLCNELP